jgi:hypothetical protein
MSVGSNLLPLGKRPLPSCLGGGDLDGDVYNLLPLNMHKNLQPLRYFKPALYAGAEKKKLDRPSTMDDVADFVMEYIISDVSKIDAMLHPQARIHIY